MNGSTDPRLDTAMRDLMDERSRGPNANAVVAAALLRTTKIVPRPAWLARTEGIVPVLRARVIPTRVVLVVATLLLLAVGLIFASGFHRRVPPPFGPARSGLIAYEANGHLWIAGPDGHAPRQLTFGAQTELAPVWSRDGTRIAFRRLTANEPADDPGRFADLIVADADGQNATTIASDVPFLSNPSWSPDDRWLAYTRSVEGSPDHLLVAAADGSGARDLGDLGGGAWGPTWAPDGNRIAVAIGNRLMLVAADGSSTRQLSHGSYQEIGSQSIVADWNPSGTELAFAAGAVGGKSVYLVGLDGAPERAFGLHVGNEEDPIWSPDGQLIAYLRSDIEQRGPVVVVTDALGNHPRDLPGHYAWSAPKWSPDGTKIIVYDDRPGVADVPGPSVVLALDAGGIERPVRLDAAAGPIANDNVAGSWQRLAP